MRKCRWCSTAFTGRSNKVFCTKVCKASAYKQTAKWKAYRSNYYILNKEKEDFKAKRWKELNSKRWKTYTKNYYIKNRIAILSRICKYNNLKYKTDLQYRLKNIIRRRVGKLLFIKRVNSYSSLFGCPIKDVIAFIESKFYSLGCRKMTWDNYGKDWQIDHIKPLALFDLNDPKELSAACHYTNLQPLWIIDHRIKTKEDLRIIAKKNKNSRRKHVKQN